MITFLHGKLVEALPTQVIVDVNGVGYEVLIPLSSFDKLPPPGQDVKLLTQLVIREDAHTLYGFMTAAERDLFRLLVNTVSGIGPKIALNILSGMNPVGVSRRGGRRRREIAFANFRRRQKNRRAHRCRVARQNRRGGRLGSRQRADTRFRPTTRKSTTPCWRSWRSASSRLKRTTPSAPRKRCSARRRRWKIWCARA